MDVLGVRVVPEILENFAGRRCQGTKRARPARLGVERSPCGARARLRGAGALPRVRLALAGASALGQPFAGLALGLGDDSDAISSESSLR